MNCNSLKASFLATVLLIATSTVWAQSAGDPLPMCEAGENAYYSFQWISGATAGAPPTANLNKITLGDYSSNPVVENIWSGQPLATVAAGMGLDGYAYGIGHFANNVSIIKYGTDGAEELGKVVHGADAASWGATPGDDITDLFDTANAGDNYNAADIDPITGHLFAGAMVAGHNYGTPPGTMTPQMSVLLEIDISTSPPQLVNVLNITPNIPQTTGDFAISADGKYAYAGSYGTPTWWTIDLQTGALTSEPLPGDADSRNSYGAAALLPNGDFAFDNKGNVDIRDESGNLIRSGLSYSSAGSQDGARCIVKPAAVPTLNQWSLLLLVLGMGSVVWLRVRRSGIRS